MCDVYCCTKAVGLTPACCTKVRSKASCKCEEGCWAMDAPGGVTSFVCYGNTQTFREDAYGLMIPTDRRLDAPASSGCKNNYLEYASQNYCSDYTPSENCGVVSAAGRTTFLNPFVVVLATFLAVVLLRPR